MPSPPCGKHLFRKYSLSKLPLWFHERVRGCMYTSGLFYSGAVAHIYVYPIHRLRLGIFYVISHLHHAYSSCFCSKLHCRRNQCYAQVTKTPPIKKRPPRRQTPLFKLEFGLSDCPTLRLRAEIPNPGRVGFSIIVEVKVKGFFSGISTLIDWHLSRGLGERRRGESWAQEHLVILLILCNDWTVRYFP